MFTTAAERFHYEAFFKSKEYTMKRKAIVLLVASTALLGACCMRPDHRDNARASYDHASYADETYLQEGTLARSDVRMLQKSLASNGFYDGPIDGIWGYQTTHAVKSYQYAHHQPQSGRLSSNDMYSLGVGKYGKYD